MTTTTVTAASTAPLEVQYVHVETRAEWARHLSNFIADTLAYSVETGTMTEAGVTNAAQCADALAEYARLLDMLKTLSDASTLNLALLRLSSVLPHPEPATND